VKVLPSYDGQFFWTLFCMGIFVVSVLSFLLGIPSLMVLRFASHSSTFHFRAANPSHRSINSSSFNVSKCPASDEDCFAYISLDDDATVYTHSSLDLRRLAAYPRYKGPGIEAQFQVQSIYSSDAVKSLKPEQRKCLFYDEKPSGEAPVYTYNLCTNNCRRKLSLKLCECVPFFYPVRGKTHLLIVLQESKTSFTVQGLDSQ